MQPPDNQPPLKRRRREKSEATNIDSEEELRVFAWNVNGIRPFLHQQQAITSFFQSSAKTRESLDRGSDPEDDSTREAPPSLRAFLRRHAFPHMLLLQEVKILAKEEETILKRIKSAVNHKTDSEDDQGSTYEVYLTLPHDSFNVKGRSYGLATIIRSDLNTLARVRSVDWDFEGRVAVVELNFPRQNASSPNTPNKAETPSTLPAHVDNPSLPSVPSRNVAIINLYAVNGTSFPYYCPKTGTVSGTRHTHKRALHARLASETRRLEDKGYGVVIAGDFNIAPAPIDGYPNLRTFPPEHVVNRADFHEWFLNKSRENGGVQMVDAWRELKGMERKYSWYPRNKEWGTSCDRVDLVLISRELVRRGALKDVGIEDSIRERGPSDHVPIWVTVSVPSGQDLDARLK